MYSLVHKSKLPSLIKFIIYIILTITIVYWLLYLVYKILDILRALIHLFTDKGHFWFMILFIIALGIGVLFLMEYVIDVGYKPITLGIEWIKEQYEFVRGYVENIISSIKNK